MGLAVGDALGHPTEFLSRQQILARYGPDGVAGFEPAGRHPAGTFTDDTQMSIAVAEGLLTAGRNASLDARMRAIADEFVRWSRSPANDRAPGRTCMTGCRNLERGVGWRSSGVPTSKGCGSAMRVTAIGLLFADDLDRLTEVARASSLLTHGHPAALEGAAASALAVALGLRRSTPTQMFDVVMQMCGGRSPDFDAAMSRLAASRSDAPERALTAGALGEAWVAEEAFVSALYCVARTPDDFAATVLCGANTDGDSDSIAAIAGSISGALNGLCAIDPAWVRGVEASDDLIELADRLREAYR